MLSSINGTLAIWYNEILTSLAGLEALTAINGNNDVDWFVITQNYKLPYCSICELYNQLNFNLSSDETNLWYNLDDACGLSSARTMADLSCN
jgi:hypothetical protein